MSNVAKLSMLGVLAVLSLSSPREAPAARVCSRTFDMASLFYEADVVAEVEELGYTEKESQYWTRTGRVRIRTIHKGDLQPGNEITVSMSKSYSTYIGHVLSRNRIRPEDFSRLGSLMFLRKTKQGDEYVPVPSGIKRIREDDVLRYIEGGYDGGTYVLVPQSPEFVKLEKDQPYTVAELRKDLQFAQKRAEQFSKAYQAADLEKLQAFVPMLPWRDPQKHGISGNLLSRKAAQKIIEKGDRELLSKVLRSHRDRSEWIVVRALEKAIRDPGQREQAMRQLDL